VFSSKALLWRGGNSRAATTIHSTVFSPRLNGRTRTLVAFRANGAAINNQKR
jgi:hypothetical protein